MNHAKVDLIAKLLAKAESTTPEEAEALTEHAERLMIKYGIEQARIDEQRRRNGEGQEEIIEERMLFTGSYARDIRELGANVAHALGSLHPLYGTDATGGAALYFVGFTSDVAQAKLLTASLQVQAMVAMRAWWAVERHRYWISTESDKRRARSSFIRGFGAGAAERIRESRRRVIDESGTGTDLVLASRRDRVTEVVDAMTTHSARRRGGADAASYHHGQKSGREASTGERQVGRG